MDGKLNAWWDFLLENDYFTEAELKLITTMYGWNEKTFNKAAYARYGMDVEQLAEPDLD